MVSPLIAEGVEVVAVVERNPSVARQRLAEFDLEAEVSTDLWGTLTTFQPDFVLDLTTPEAHCQVTCAALGPGCHVIGEKPMAASIAEAREMVHTAEATGRMYMVSQSRRWDPNWQRQFGSFSGRHRDMGKLK